ncbi:MAG TPA: SMP-30/gluconolactonase/LRE family protein [Gemmatimonadales bacterium]|nr:SMP-30/gluconolactonase/LRE family protein [Gemmatimonadales bacterium]
MLRSTPCGLTARTTCASRDHAPPRRLAEVTGLQASEAVVYDPATDSYLVSNVNGSPGVKDGNGFISRITGDGKLQDLHFIQGGQKGVTLNAPMGSRVRGDTLWVLDVDVLRSFNTRTGAPQGAVDLAPAGALFLNDFDFAPDGSIYVSDMRLRAGADGKMAPAGPGRLYRVAPDRRVSVALESDALTFPDGIGWDARGKRIVIAPFQGTSVQEWRPGEAQPRAIAQGKGRFDGVEVERDGSILITIWNDSTVSTLDDGRLTRRIGPMTMTPADVSMDRRRGRVGVVSMEANRFELWTWSE